MDYHLINKHGHIEVIDNNGAFVCSADTIAEAMSEITEIIYAESNSHFINNKRGAIQNEAV